MATQLKKGTLELCVMALLSHKEWYGYELTQELNKAMIVKDATIYLILQRLEKAFLLHSEVRAVPNETKVRKYYTLSVTGKQKLNELISEWNTLEIVVNQCINEGSIINE
jgi:Predicted transcriptional regulators